MSKKKVYVSSTYVDLKDYRLAVKTALERAQYDVECMEKYPAFDERPKDKCLGDVDECDYYVLILAHRYGFVPPKDNPQRKSITHLEYEQAVVQVKPILPFLVAKSHPWSPEFMDSDSLASGSPIVVFRDLVALEHGVQRFTTPDDLASKVLQALSAQVEKTQRKLGKPRDSAAAPAFRWPTPWDFTAYVESRRDGFVGRDWLFANIDDWLARDTPRALLIRADFGVGKSAIIAELLRRKARGTVAGWHFCQHDVRETLYPATFVRSFAAQFRDTIAGYRDAIGGDSVLQERLDATQDDPSSAFEAAILNVLARLAPPLTPRLLLLDALGA